MFNAILLFLYLILLLILLDTLALIRFCKEIIIHFNHFGKRESGQGKFQQMLVFGLNSLPSTQGVKTNPIFI